MFIYLITIILYRCSF